MTLNGGIPNVSILWAKRGSKLFLFTHKEEVPTRSYTVELKYTGRNTPTVNACEES